MAMGRMAYSALVKLLMTNDNLWPLVHSRPMRASKTQGNSGFSSSQPAYAPFHEALFFEFDEGLVEVPQGGLVPRTQSAEKLLP